LLDRAGEKLVTQEQGKRVARMGKQLVDNTRVRNSEENDEDRRKQFDELLAILNVVLDKVARKPYETDAEQRARDDVYEGIVVSLADAAEHCVTAWEAAIHDSLRRTCPEINLKKSKNSGQDLEDYLLEELMHFRENIAEQTFEKAKAQAGETDVHFSSYFYDSIHFGLPGRYRPARKDPSRRNYAHLNLVSIDDIHRELWSQYGVKSIVAKVKELVSPGTYWYGKTVDFIKSIRFPCIAEEQWLREWCSTEEYLFKYEAIVLMLAHMRIIDADVLSEVRPVDV